MEDTNNKKSKETVKTCGPCGRCGISLQMGAFVSSMVYMVLGVSWMTDTSNGILDSMQGDEAGKGVWIGVFYNGSCGFLSCILALLLFIGSQSESEYLVLFFCLGTLMIHASSIVLFIVACAVGLRISYFGYGVFLLAWVWYPWWTAFAYYLEVSGMNESKEQSIPQQNDVKTDNKENTEEKPEKVNDDESKITETTQTTNFADAAV